MGIETYELYFHGNRSLLQPARYMGIETCCWIIVFVNLFALQLARYMGIETTKALMCFMLGLGCNLLAIWV